MGHVQSLECLHRELRAIPGTGLLQVIEIEEMGWVSLPASRENRHRLAENLDRGGRERYVDSAGDANRTDVFDVYDASETEAGSPEVRLVFHGDGDDPANGVSKQKRHLGCNGESDETGTRGGRTMR